MLLHVKNPQFPSSKHSPAKKNKGNILMTPFALILGDNVYKEMVFCIVEWIAMNSHAVIPSIRQRVA